MKLRAKITASLVQKKVKPLKTKFLLGAIVVAVLTVFGHFGLQQMPVAEASFNPDIASGSMIAPVAMSFNNAPVIAGQGVWQQATTCSQAAVTAIACDTSAKLNSASLPQATLTFTVFDQFGRVIQQEVLSVPVTYGNTRSEPLRDGSTFGDQRTTDANQFGLLPFSGTQLTQSVDGYSNFEGVISASVYVDTALAPGTITPGMTNVQDASSLTMGGVYNPGLVTNSYPLGNNLSLPNYLGVPNIVLTATITIADPPASITVAAASTSLNCGEKATTRCTLSSAGQNVSDRIRVVFNGFSSVAGGNVYQALTSPAGRGTIVIDTTAGIAYLLTSTDHVGPYEGVKSSWSIGDKAYFPWYNNQGLLTNRPSSAPVNAQATVTSTVAVASAAASHLDVTAPRTGQGPADAFAIPPAPVADLSASGLQVELPSSTPVNAQATVTCNGDAGGGATCAIITTADTGEAPVNAIRPPNTGDAGLASSSSSSGPDFSWQALILITAVVLVGVRAVKRARF